MYVGSNLKWDSDSTWFHLNLNCQFLASREILVPNGSSKKHLKIGATNLVCGGYPILIHVWHFRKVRQLEPEYYMYIFIYIYILSVWTSIQYMKKCIKSSLYVKYDNYEQMSCQLAKPLPLVLPRPRTTRENMPPCTFCATISGACGGVDLCHNDTSEMMI